MEEAGREKGKVSERVRATPHELDTSFKTPPSELVRMGRAVGD